MCGGLSVGVGVLITVNNMTVILSPLWLVGVILMSCALTT